MQYSTILVGLFAAATMASPLVAEERSLPIVGYGQELQNGDQTNHWVAWVEGESACPAAQVLSVLTESPCGQKFTLKGVEYTFGSCNGNEPSVVLYGGNAVYTCRSDSDKINCHGSQHDIVKHGRCT